MVQNNIKGLLDEIDDLRQWAQGVVERCDQFEAQVRIVMRQLASCLIPEDEDE